MKFYNYFKFIKSFDFIVRLTKLDSYFINNWMVDML